MYALGKELAMVGFEFLSWLALGVVVALVAVRFSDSKAVGAWEAIGFACAAAVAGGLVGIALTPGVSAGAYRMLGALLAFGASAFLTLWYFSSRAALGRQ